MILALLGLIAHQHDSDDSQDQCPAAAWHSGAVHGATPQLTTPGRTERVVEYVTPSVAAPATQVLRLFQPRGPPSIS